MRSTKSFLVSAVLSIVLTLSACSFMTESVPEPDEIHFQVNFQERFNTDPLAKRFMDAVSDFNELNPTIKVIIDYLPPTEDDIQIITTEDLVKLMESEQAPDVIPWPPHELQVAHEKGLLRDLLSLDLGDVDIPRNILDSGIVDGKQLLLPYGAHPNGVFFNKDLLDEAQIPYPEGDWTWQQYRDISTRMAGRGSILPYDISTLQLLLESGHSGVLSPDGKTAVGYLDSPMAVRIMQWLNSWYRDENLTTPVDSLDTFEQFGLAQRGMFVGTLGARFYHFEGENKKKLGVASLPYFEGGERANSVYLSGYGISSKSKHPDAAWKFIRYLVLEANEHSLELSEDYIPTSKAMAEATNVSADPFKSVFNEELKYAVQSSGGYNPYAYETWLELKSEFEQMLTAEDDEIPDKLHKLAVKHDQVMERLISEGEQQTERAS